MKFNILIKIYLSPILKKYRFEIVEESENVVRFQSSIVEVNIIYNHYDNSCLVEIGKIDGYVYPLNDDAIKNIFKLNISVEHVPADVFVQNLVLLFKQKKGDELLKGNIRILEECIKQQSEKYTSELVRQQLLLIALNAWETNDYDTFIRTIDQIGLDKIERSYLLRYKLAKRRCGLDY